MSPSADVGPRSVAVSGSPAVSVVGVWGADVAFRGEEEGATWNVLLNPEDSYFSLHPGDGGCVLDDRVLGYGRGLHLLPVHKDGGLFQSFPGPFFITTI